MWLQCIMVYFLILSEERLVSGPRLRWISLPPGATVGAKWWECGAALWCWCADTGSWCSPHGLYTDGHLSPTLQQQILCSDVMRSCMRSALHAYLYIYTRVCAGVRFVLLIASAFCRLEEGQRRGVRGGSCNSEWTALHWQDKIRIDRPITASLQKQQRQKGGREGGRRREGDKKEEVGWREKRMRCKRKRRERGRCRGSGQRGGEEVEWCRERAGGLITRNEGRAQTRGGEV